MEFECLDRRRVRKNAGSKGSYKYVCLLSVDEEAPIDMTDFGGVTVCGKRGGKSFEKAQRPLSDGLCP